MQADQLLSVKNKALLFRVSAHLILAALAVSLPAVGPNRFWLAGLLLCVGTPTAILVNQRVRGIERNWAEALVDLTMVVTLIHLVPHLWMVSMALGLMVALAPSISLHPRSHWIYMSFGAVLLIGMTVAAATHDVQNWELVVLAVAVTYPALLYYTYSQMQAANEMRKRAEMVRGMSQLAGSVAHDFNNMLMGISGHTEVALTRLPSDHDARENLQRVLQGTKRASLLTNRLLRFAGREMGRKELINVIAEFRVIAELLQPALPAGTSVAYTGIEDPLYVEANVTDLHQVWMNVLLNAGESMQGKEAMIDVRFSRTVNREIETPPQIEIVVSDRGGGISADALEKVFDPFFSTKKQGHGLGLAVSSRIMQQLNGDIVIRKRTGGGTEVLLSFPEAQARPFESESLDSKDSSPAPDAKALTILVVDDEPEVRDVTAGLLTNLGHESLMASNAEEAVTIFTARHDSIGAVMLDLRMPGRDGWACLEDIRKIDAAKPVIICSGFNPASKLPAPASSDKNLQFLSKPFRIELLAEVLAKSQ